MVNPEFKSFDFTVKSAGRFTLNTDKGVMLDFSGSAMTAGYEFIQLPVAAVSTLVFRTDAHIKLTDKLKELTGFEKVAYTNSGTEACDMALSRYNNSTIISFEGSYHGRSYLTFKVSNGTGIDRKCGIVHLKFPNSTISTEDAISTNYDILEEAGKNLFLVGSTVILELIQSDGGENVITEQFVKFLQKMISDYRMHLIVDEVYTGAGRSGELILSAKYPLKPDMICLGKGIAAGIPAGIVLYRGEWALPTENGALGMLGGNDMVCRASLEVLYALNEDRLSFVRRSGDDIILRIRKLESSRIKEVRGKGFMIGVELVDEDGNPDTVYAYAVRDALAEKHIICGLVGEHNNVLKITPPVMIDKDTLEDGVNRLLSVLGDENL